MSKLLHIAVVTLRVLLQVSVHLFVPLDHLSLGNVKLFLVDRKSKPKDNTNLSKRSWRGSGPSLDSDGSLGRMWQGRGLSKSLIGDFKSILVPGKSSN